MSGDLLDDAAGGPSATISRVVEWPDTDAAGHYHHSTVIRWVEAAEAALDAKLGLLDLFGKIPRVHYEVDYGARLWFRDEVDITITVSAVGTSSVTYAFDVRRGEELAAHGSMTAVQIDQATGRTIPWSERVRIALGAPTAAPN